MRVSVGPRLLQGNGAYRVCRQQVLQPGGKTPRFCRESLIHAQQISITLQRLGPHNASLILTKILNPKPKAPVNSLPQKKLSEISARGSPGLPGGNKGPGDASHCEQKMSKKYSAPPDSLTKLTGFLREGSSRGV